MATTNLTPQTTPIPQRHVPARRVAFDPMMEDLPKYFAKDIYHSHLAAALSAVFPDGEDYFVRSVRHFRDQITDPELKKQVSGFIGQEAIHGREHRALNDRLAEHGYPVRRSEWVSSKILDYREKNRSPLWNLAATAALEHFTATFAETVMEEGIGESLTDHDGIMGLFLWHALEECEHKSVAFDVYRAVGGDEKLRLRVMRVVAFSFIVGISFGTFSSLLQDRNFYRPSKMREAWHGIRNSPFFNRANLRKIRAYNVEGFHPDQVETDHLVEKYRELLFGTEGNLNKVLKGAA